MSRATPPYGLLLAALATGFVAGNLLPTAPFNVLWARAESRATPRQVTERDEPLPPHEDAVVRMFDDASRSVVFIATSTLKRSLAIPGLLDAKGQPQTFAIGDDDYVALRTQWQESPQTFGINIDSETVLSIDPNLRPDDFDWDSGSGIVWDHDGHIITNLHVVRDAWSLIVRLHDLRNYPATIIGCDEDKDVAVLQIEAPPEALRPIRIGRSRDLRVGQRAYSIGNPFGLSSTLTEGILSAVGRTIRSGTGSGRIIQDVLQTDAAINPGNSGGPLLDSSGRLIGLTTATLSENGSAGIGFAIPIDTVNRIVPDIINFGYTTRAGLGIRVRDVKDAFGGVRVEDVLASSAADIAGLRGEGSQSRFRYDGDIIVAIDGVQVQQFDDLYQILDRHQPGDSIRIAYRREGQTFQTVARLQTLPPPGPLDPPEPMPAATQILP